MKILIKKTHSDKRREFAGKAQTKMQYRKIIVLFLLVTTIVGCRLTEKKSAEMQAIATLKEFYTLWITENAKSQIDENAIDAIKQKYISSDLLASLNELELDYDPFLDAQDCDEKWLKTIEIKPVEGKENVFIVCYQTHDFRGKRENCITLFIVKINGKYQINDTQSYHDDFGDV
jgi:hypothetical protein